MTDVVDRAELLEHYRARVRDWPDRAEWVLWCRTLLAHGGSLVVPHPGGEPHLSQLIDAARHENLAVHDGPVPFVEGEPCSCHTNASRLWLEGRCEGIGTGYALSGDGLWLQHSWGVAGDGSPVETTAPRDRYVGVHLAGPEVLPFVLANTDPGVLAELTAPPRARPDLLEILHAGLARWDPDRA